MNVPDTHGLGMERHAHPIARGHAIEEGPDAPRWYAVQARPKQEQRAAMNLVSAGVTTFLPLVRQSRREGASSIVPLFPRYLFVQCDIARSSQRIRYTRGVAKVVGTSDGPSAIDDAVIASVRERVGADGFVRLTQTFAPGDAAEITSGPLKGFAGVFQATTSAAERVVLLLNAMNGQMRVLIDASVVRRATA